MNDFEQCWPDFTFGKLFIWIWANNETETETEREYMYYVRRLQDMTYLNPRLIYAKVGQGWSILYPYFQISRQQCPINTSLWWRYRHFCNSTSRYADEFKLVLTNLPIRPYLIGVQLVFYFFRMTRIKEQTRGSFLNSMPKLILVNIG